MPAFIFVKTVHIKAIDTIVVILFTMLNLLKMTAFLSSTDVPLDISIVDNGNIDPCGMPKNIITKEK